VGINGNEVIGSDSTVIVEISFISAQFVEESNKSAPDVISTTTGY